jgi:stalled ribosome rescue protein Dom34
MSEHYHAVVWIDHREARVFQFNASDVDEQRVQAQDPAVHIHHRAGSVGAGHAAEDQEFFHQVATAVARQKAILITGPASARHELVKHLERHDPQVAQAVAGVEAIDHPSDGELIAFARKFFRAADRMTPQRS